MKHSFKLKKNLIKSVFINQLGFNSLTIEDKNDVLSSIYTILSFIELEHVLTPVNCSYNFINSTIFFQLELISGNDKLHFFEAIKKFEEYITIEKPETV